MTGAKMRVYEIAKEVGIPNKDLIAKIRALGLEVNNHMSSLDADDVARIKRSLEKEKTGGAAPAQTQKLSSGTVLRRRSSGDKADNVTETPVVAAPPAPAASDTVVRRRKPVADEAPAVETKPHVEAPHVQVRKAAPVESAPVVEERPAPPKVTAPPPPVEVVEAKPVV